MLTLKKITTTEFRLHNKLYNVDYSPQNYFEKFRFEIIFQRLLLWFFLKYGFYFFIQKLKLIDDRFLFQLYFYKTYILTIEAKPKQLDLNALIGAKTLQYQEQYYYIKNITKYLKYNYLQILLILTNHSRYKKKKWKKTDKSLVTLMQKNRKVLQPYKNLGSLKGKKVKRFQPDNHAFIKCIKNSTSTIQKKLKIKIFSAIPGRTFRANLEKKKKFPTRYFLIPQLNHRVTSSIGFIKLMNIFADWKSSLKKKIVQTTLKRLQFLMFKNKRKKRKFLLFNRTLKKKCKWIESFNWNELFKQVHEPFIMDKKRVAAYVRKVKRKPKFRYYRIADKWWIWPQIAFPIFFTYFFKHFFGYPLVILYKSLYKQFIVTMVLRQEHRHFLSQTWYLHKVNWVFDFLFFTHYALVRSDPNFILPYFIFHIRSVFEQSPFVNFLAKLLEFLFDYKKNIRGFRLLVHGAYDRESRETRSRVWLLKKGEITFTHYESHFYFDTIQWPSLYGITSFKIWWQYDQNHIKFKNKYFENEELAWLRWEEIQTKHLNI